MTHRSLLCLGIAVLFLSGCASDRSNGPTVPAASLPFTIPSPATMQIDLQDLADSTALRPGIQPASHDWTGLVVWWYGTYLAKYLSVPTAVLASCAHTPFIAVGDTAWTWTASGGQGADAWTAVLTASAASPTEIDWKMSVTGTRDNLRGFVWLEGESEPLARTGIWRYYGQQWLLRTLAFRCPWSFSSSSGPDRTLAFTGGPEGDGLTFTEAGTLRSAEVTFSNDVLEFVALQTFWNPQGGSGHLVVSNTGAPGADTLCWGPRPNYPNESCR